MHARGMVILAVVTLMTSVPAFALAQMGSGQGMGPGMRGGMAPGAGPIMQMQGMMQ